MAGTAADPWVAWPAPTAPAQLSRAISRAHDRFVSSGRVPARSVRSAVRQSWLRSAHARVDPGRSLAPVELVDDALTDYRDAHPLAISMPLIRRLLVPEAADEGLVVAVGDADGRLLWVEGNRRLISAAESMHFVEGSRWRESDVGTNAPGTALAVDHGIQVYASEHFTGIVQPWSCSAVPVHDPSTGGVLGVIDVTGGDAAAAPYALTAVRATVAAVENQLALLRLQGQIVPAVSGHGSYSPSVGTPRLLVLGRDRASLVRPGDPGPLELSLRHSELLLLLSRAPRGATAEELSVQLHPYDAPAVTVRAELSRLRRAVGEGLLASRPYRVDPSLRTDADDVTDALDAGALAAALTAFTGPVLPRSESPAVADIRNGLYARLRASVLASGTGAQAHALASTDPGADDRGLWSAALSRLPADSPLRPQVAAELMRIDRELGL